MAIDGQNFYAGFDIAVSSCEGLGGLSSCVYWRMFLHPAKLSWWWTMPRSLSIPPALTGGRQSDGSCAQAGSYLCSPKEREVGELVMVPVKPLQEVTAASFC